MNKWYAIKRPNGEWVPDAVSDTIIEAWEYAFDVEHFTRKNPDMTTAEAAEEAGYTCVEVELAHPGTADALKRAKLAWDALVAIGASISAAPGNQPIIDQAMLALNEALGEVKP